MSDLEKFEFNYHSYKSEEIECDISDIIYIDLENEHINSVLENKIKILKYNLENKNYRTFIDISNNLMYEILECITSNY